MPTIPTAGIGAAHDVEEEFLAVLFADEELLRAEFDAIIAREWPTRRPPAEPAASSRGTGPQPQRPLAHRAPPAPLGTARHPGGRRQGRQRSPP